MSTAPWPATGTCAVCTALFFPKSTVQRYCSTRCRERAKYDRVRNDPARWSKYLEGLRLAYQPTGRPPGVAPKTVGCSVDGCGDKHLARGFCRKHYRRDRYRRGLDRETPSELISALVKRYDADGKFVEEPVQRRVVAHINGGLLMLECPNCGTVMMKLPAIDDMDLRDCGRCRVRALLNSEEVSWLTSGALSTEQSVQIKNS